MHSEKGDIAAAEIEFAKGYNQTLQTYNTRRSNLIKNVANISRKNNITLIFVQAPLCDLRSIKSVLRDYPEVIYVENKDNFLNEIKNVGYFGLMNDFEFYFTGHFGGKGEELVVENIFKTLEEEGLLE
ncbi:hypothetical protein KY334_00085 [Candidatus Woesearchaeota archaeon]|nr:hypothetical protein [Candidatus Woesearchaeota archaeon]